MPSRPFHNPYRVVLAWGRRGPRFWIVGGKCRLFKIMAHSGRAINGQKSGIAAMTGCLGAGARPLQWLTGRPSVPRASGSPSSVGALFATKHLASKLEIFHIEHALFFDDGDHAREFEQEFGILLEQTVHLGAQTADLPTDTGHAVEELGDAR